MFLANSFCGFSPEVLLSLVLSYEGLSFWGMVHGIPLYLIDRMRNELHDAYPEIHSQSDIVFFNLSEYARKLFWIKCFNLYSYLIKAIPPLVVFGILIGYTLIPFCKNETLWSFVTRRVNPEGVLVLVLIGAIVQMLLSVVAFVATKALPTFIRFSPVSTNGNIESAINQLTSVPSDDFPDPTVSFDDASIAEAIKFIRR